MLLEFLVFSFDRNALVELDVLQDVLSIAKGKRYMHLDPISVEGPEPRGNLLLVARKKVTF